MPVRIEAAADGGAGAIVFATTEIRDGFPVEIPGTEERVPVTTVIRAIGQTKHVALFDRFAIAHARGKPLVDETLRTSDPRVFVAGDCVFESGVTDAMVVFAAQQGKEVATHVDCALGGGERVRRG
jgi:glutamate synthase (NADPH/NADH) small chain